jgi:uncharacterized protein
MISFFEIPVLDLDRAERFYAVLLDARFERGSVDGLEMSFFASGLESADPEVVRGALVRGESYVPSHNGTRVYFIVANLEATLLRAERIGARLLYPRTAIGAHGFVGEVEDTEGNRIALHERAL